MTSSAIAELERPSRVACSDLLAHWFVILPSLHLLPASAQEILNCSFENNYHENQQTHLCSATTHNIRRRKQPLADDVSQQARNNQNDVSSSSHRWCGLTSRAQARGVDDVLRDSGTGPAIPRCLQLFDTPFKALFGFGNHRG